MKQNNSPLANLLRPKNFDEIVGQNHLFGLEGALTLMQKNKNVPSVILSGPAGVGKTTIAKILANIIDADFVIISAVQSNVAEIRQKISEIKKKSDPSDLLTQSNKKTILMVDEIHHFNKTQQDLFLPFIEDGTIILVGTTTENPSFALNSAILSRCKVLSLEPLNQKSLLKLLKKSEEFYDFKLPISQTSKEILAESAGGDGRYFLNICEEIFSLARKENIDLSEERILKIVTKRSAHFDNKGEFFYNLISAFHKSLRGSDIDASLYYLARMLVAGQNPHYILRRMARFATEDVGIADPNALLQVMAAKENYDYLGSPEGDYSLSHAAIYLASAPKSNSSYKAHKAAVEAAKNSTEVNPPKNILNAPTKLMKEQGYNAGYIYDHDLPNAFSGQEFFPPEILKKGRPNFYEPNDRGFEREVKKRMEYWNKLKQEKNSN